jgi:hypothetical protein
VQAFGAGARHFASVEELSPSVSGRQHPRQGLALHEDGARGGGAHRRAAEGVTDAARVRAVAGQGRARSSTSSATSRCGRCSPASRRSRSRSSSARIHPQADAYKIGQAVRDDGRARISPRPARRPWAAR